MAHAAENCYCVTKPGILAFGKDLPPESAISSCFRDETVVQISCGTDHSAVVCASGSVCTFGKNQFNGWVENNAKTVVEPALVVTLSSVRINQVACGFQFTVFLTDTGEVYSCGLNKDGQLGLGHTNKCPVPTLVTGLPPIVKVAAGYEYTVAITDSGQVWVTGRNEDGQLGLGHREGQISFTRVPDLPDIVSDISCGAYHTALLLRSGVLLMTGKNNYGQLALGKIDSLCSFQPVSESAAAGVSAVTCGYYHTVALRVDGTTWAWGNNKAGQVGIGDATTEHFFTPMKMIGLDHFIISKVFAGCHSTALLTKDGNVLVCGTGKYGGQLNKRLVPTLLQKAPGLFVQQVALALNYSLMFVVPKPNHEPSALQQAGENVSDSGMLARGCVTDLERNILRLLECPVCFHIMCVPIYQCLRGHSLCNTCRSHTDTTVCPLCQEAFNIAKNITLESLIADVQLPCTDCLERMPATLLAKHADVCPARKYSCPVQPCGWIGRPETMLAHTSSTHPDQTWGDLPHLFIYSTSDKLVHTNVLAWYNEVFTLHRRYKKATREFQAVVRYIGAPENKHKFKFEFAFIFDVNNNVTFHRNICADTENIEDMFQSANCVSLEQKQLDTCIKQDKLVCRVAVQNADPAGLAHQIKALLDA